MPQRVYQFDESEHSEVVKVLNYDPALDKSLDAEALRKIMEDEYKSVIFARQEYSIREGKLLGLDDKLYLYISADDDFLEKADKMLKHEFKTMERAPKEVEDKVIEAIKEEESGVNQGFGSLFG